MEENLEAACHLIDDEKKMGKPQPSSARKSTLV